MESFETLLQRFQEGGISRRRFVQGMAAAALAAATPEWAEAAGPLKPTWVSHYTYVAPDLKKTTDWYHEVFGMQVEPQNAKTNHLWYGSMGYDTLAIFRQANAGERAPRIEKFAFTIEPFDKKVVEVELKKRGSKTRSDDKGLWFTDLDGNWLGMFPKGYHKRPTPKNEKPMLWKAISSNHVSVMSKDYRKLADWYLDLMDLKETSDDGRDVFQHFDPCVWVPTRVAAGEKTSAELQTVDHVALTIEDYKSDQVEAELRRRQMIKPEAKVTGSLGINCVDINGHLAQVCALNLFEVGEKNRKNIKR